MKPISVRELKKQLESLITAGYGDYSVQLSDDEEINDTHLAFGKIYKGDRVFYFNEKTKKNEDNNSLIIC